MKSKEKEKEKELELNVSICIEEDLPDDAEILVFTSLFYLPIMHRWKPSNFKAFRFIMDCGSFMNKCPRQCMSLAYESLRY